MGDVISLHVWRWGPYCDPMVLAGPAVTYSGRVRQIDGAGEEDYATEFIFKELSDTRTWTWVLHCKRSGQWHSVPAPVSISGPSGFSQGDASSARSTLHR